MYDKGMLIRGFVFLHLPDWNDLPVMERWYHRCHAPDVAMQAPWMQRYLSFNAVNPPPQGAEEFGFMNHRVHETLQLAGDHYSENRKPSARPIPAYTDAAMVWTTGQPDQDFKGASACAFEKPILRWITAISYPENIGQEEGDDWYINTFAPELAQLPKITRFYSYKAIKREPVPQENPENPHIPMFRSREMLSPLLMTEWNRVSEIWVESANDWTETFITNSPKFTKPAWAETETFPFLVPHKGFISSFLLERPTEDLLKTSEFIYC